MGLFVWPLVTATAMTVASLFFDLLEVFVPLTILAGASLVATLVSLAPAMTSDRAIVRFH